MFYSRELLPWIINNISPNWEQLARAHLSNSCKSGPWVYSENYTRRMLYRHLGHPKTCLLRILTTTTSNSLKILKVFHAGPWKLGKIDFKIENSLRLYKLFHQWQHQDSKTNHELDSLRVRKVFQVVCWQLGKINHWVAPYNFRSCTIRDHFNSSKTTRERAKYKFKRCSISDVANLAQWSS